MEPLNGRTFYNTTGDSVGRSDHYGNLYNSTGDSVGRVGSDRSVYNSIGDNTHNISDSGAITDSAGDSSGFYDSYSGSFYSNTGDLRINMD